MKVFASALLSLLALCMLTACGGDDVADDPKLSEEGKAIVQEVGGPFSKDEFNKFLADLGDIPGLTAQSMEDSGEVSTENLNEAIVKAVKEHGWNEDRFMYIYSHTMTMVNLEQMERVAGEMQDRLKGVPEEQRQMMEQMLSQQIGGQMEAVRAEVDKQVPSSEQAIVQANMDKLLATMGMQ